MIDLDAGENIVGLVGDTHGNTAWCLHVIDKSEAAQITTVLHAGDFSIWPGPNGKKFRLRLDAQLKEARQTWLITPGNHESWEMIDARRVSPDGLKWFGEKIAVMPRGTRWTWEDIDFMSLGGAPSVDREDRTEGIDWWAAEAIADTDVNLAVAGGPVDVMLTHDAPEPCLPEIQSILDFNPMGWPQRSLDYAADGRARLTKVFHAVKPRLLVHGHHHLKASGTVWLPDAVWDTQITSLGCDGTPGNTAALDLSGGAYDLKVQWL